MHTTLKSCCFALSISAASGLAGCAEPAEAMRVEVMRAEVSLSPGNLACGATPPVGRLCGCVYDLPLETRRLPDFSELSPVEMLCVDQLAVTLRRGAPGFPGITSRYEWFGADFTGVLIVDQPGLRMFRLASDDGAKLIIDDKVVLNNDGLHDRRVVEGPVELTRGPHVVHVPYWDGPGPMALTLEVAKPGQPYEIVRFDRAL